MKLRTKIPYILISLFISLMLWVYMVSIQQPETEETISGIKVVLEGAEQLYEDRGLLITSQSVPTVSLVVRGNMIDLSRLKTRKDKILITADLSVITSPGQNRLAYDIESLPVDNVSVLDRNPVYINLTVEKVQSNIVDIVVRNEGSIAEGYMAEEPVITPISLQVSGPAETIKSIAYAEVVWTRENQERTLTNDLEFTFRDENGKEVSKEGITTNYDYVTVTYHVKKVRELNLLVDIIDGGGAKKENIEYIISPEVITVAGDPEIVDGLNSITVGRIELAKIIRPGELEFSILVPNEVENISGEKICKVEIKAIVGVSTREYATDVISLINPPEGLKAEVITQELSVRLRGKEEILDLIYGHNLRAVADLADSALSEGRYSVPVSVYLDGYPDVGVVGEYRIVIEVKPEDSE